MGWHLDGRVAAVFGTHTHVPTADGRVLPQGTAYISDVGMTGSRTSVLGVKPEQALEGLITQMPVKFETASEDVWVMGAVVEVNAEGLADSIEQVMVARSLRGASESSGTAAESGRSEAPDRPFQGRDGYEE